MEIKVGNNHNKPVKNNDCNVIIGAKYRHKEMKGNTEIVEKVEDNFVYFEWSKGLHKIRLDDFHKHYEPMQVQSVDQQDSMIIDKLYHPYSDTTKPKLIVDYIYSNTQGKEVQIKRISEDLKTVIFNTREGIANIELDSITFSEKYPICITPGIDDHNDTADVMSYNIGTSDYSKNKIQPWDIFEAYPRLNYWDCDIIKRVLRDKKTDSRRLDYEKIIHICKKRIQQIDDGVNV